MVPAAPIVAVRTALLASGVLAGSLVAVLLAELTLRGNPAGYIAFHQATTLVYTATLPVIGAIMTVSLVVTLVRGRTVPGIRRLLVIALACGVAGMLVTAAIHFPLNATILAWPVGVIPSDFASVSTRWLAAHVVRTVVTLTAFVLIMIAFARVSRADTRS